MIPTAMNETMPLKPTGNRGRASECGVGIR